MGLQSYKWVGEILGTTSPIDRQHDNDPPAGCHLY
jgi:hypothetical protein